MARKVISMSNSIQLTAIEKLQKKMKAFDAEKAYNLKAQVERKFENKFFSMNL